MDDSCVAFILLGDIGSLLLTRLVFLLILVALPAVFFFAVSATQRRHPPAAITALAASAALWFVAVVSGRVLPAPETQSTEIAVGILLTTAVALRWAPGAGWPAWIALLAFGPVGSVYLIWRGRHLAEAPRAEASPEVGPAVTHRPAAGTKTIGMSPEVRLALRRSTWLWLGLAAVGFGLLVQAYLATQESGGDGSAEGLLTLRLILGGMSGVALVAIAPTRWLRLEQDLRAGTLVRTSGRVRSTTNFWHLSGRPYRRVWVADRELTSMGGVSGVWSPLAGMEWASVDYAPRSHYLLAIRDASGATVYS